MAGNVAPRVPAFAFCIELEDWKKKRREPLKAESLGRMWSSRGNNLGRCLKGGGHHWSLRSEAAACGRKKMRKKSECVWWCITYVWYHFSITDMNLAVFCKQLNNLLACMLSPLGPGWGQTSNPHFVFLFSETLGGSSASGEALFFLFLFFLNGPTLF